MSKGIARIGRPGYDSITADDKDLSYSSEWRTPKIFAQVGLRKRYKFHGATSPIEVNGFYDIEGTHNGRIALTNGTYWIWWDGSTNWNLTGTKGSGTVIFYNTDGYEDARGWYNEGSGTGSPVSLGVENDKIWGNELGYIPSFFGFRQLSNQSPAVLPFNTSGYESAGLNSNCYTYSSSSTGSDSMTEGVFVRWDEDINLGIWNGWKGFDLGYWNDEGIFALLSLDPLEGTPPQDYDKIGGPRYALSREGIDSKTAFPYYNSVDNRLDSFKIFETGEANLTMPSETVSGSKKVYTEIIPHNLGYAPVYLPEAGVGWALGFSQPGYGSFILNDYLGFEQGSGEVIVDVYVDSQNLYLRYTRYPRVTAYPSATVTMYYTIFYNEIGEEFGLL